MTMLQADADGLMRKWGVRLKLEATRLKPSMSQSVWFTRNVQKWQAFRLTRKYLFPALRVLITLLAYVQNQSLKSQASDLKG